MMEYRARGQDIPSGDVVYIRCEKPNRGGQMNAGGRIAPGDVLLFHHADTELNGEHIASIQHAASDPKFRSGSFYRRFDPAQRRRAWLVPIVRFYNRHFGALYGDQSLFITREHFIATGGFKDFPLLEDVEYSRRFEKTAGSSSSIRPSPPMAEDWSTRGMAGDGSELRHHGALFLRRITGVAASMVLQEEETKTAAHPCTFIRLNSNSSRKVWSFR